MGTELLLKNIGRHIRLDEAEESYFLSLLQPKTILKKEFLLHAGEVSTMETFVTKGCLRTYYLDEKGDEHIVMFAPEDWWTGDMYSFLAQAPAVFNIDALEDTEVLQIGRTQLEMLYDRVPKFDRFFRILLQNAFIAQQRRIVQNLSFPAEQRYAEFLKRYPQLEQRIPQKQVAAYLGITPEFLSVLRRRFVRA